MVNELQSQEWAYLLDPCFQLVNTNGKPLTNGHIEVFYHGTRTPYYCASDWNGTLHPFKIKIDSLGSNVVLADPNYSYDVYVYNAYGVLQMSRYNVNPGVGGSGGSSSSDGEAPHWNSDPNGGASSSVTGGTTVYLTLPSSEDQPDFVDHSTDTAIFLKEGLYHIDAVVSFKQDEDDLQNIIKDLVVNTGLIGWDAQMTGQKNWTGPESTDDDRHFLELHTVVSVPEDLLQPLYFQISSPVDLDSAAIEKLDIVKLTAGGGGMTYAAGYGIDITNQVISVSGMIPESAAANFVDVSAYNTDIQNIYETIAETSAMIPSGVATEQWVTNYSSAFITEDALDGYATQEWVVDQGYITSADLPQSVPLVAGEGISIVDTSASTIISVDSAYSPGVSEEWVEDYVSNATSGFITSADIPEVPEDLVTSAELATVSGDIVNQIPTLDGYATQQWVEDQHYITSADIPPIPQDVVTSGELATVSGDIVSQIPSLDGYATEQFVEDYTSAFITSADVPSPVTYTAGSHIDITNDVISVTGVSGLFAGENVTITTSGGNYYINSTGGGDVPSDVVTSGQLATVSGNIMNEIPNYTAGDNISIVNDEISVSGTAGLIAGDNINITTSGDSYVISSTGGGGSGSDVDIIPTIQTGTKIADYVIDGTSGMLYAPDGGGEITYPLVYESSNPEEDNIMTSAVLIVDDGGIVKNIMTTSPYEIVISREIPSIHSIARTTIDYNGIHLENEYDDEYIYTNDVIAWNNTKNAVINSANKWNSAYNAINASASNWNDAAGMNEYPISAGPGMSIEDVDGVTVFSCTGGEVPADVVTSGQLATVSGEIMNEIPDLTGYATQTWVSDGFMETSGLEFNSQDEISGYNGHPVMTVDSEKQWLTHDDTIAHVTNSAQYAFGVNVPVVAQAMGTDETELWSGNNVDPSSTTITLSEDPRNFERIRFYWGDSRWFATPIDETRIQTSSQAVIFMHSSGSANAWIHMLSLTVAGTSVSVNWAKNFNFGSTTTTTWSTPIINLTVGESFYLSKIVGIGRKETA